ncbi:MAG: c-type cytochrome [Anaerolineae bacterium]|nr:c-type cytochrome [Anaerolineae bacterium]
MKQITLLMLALVVLLAACNASIPPSGEPTASAATSSGMGSGMGMGMGQQNGMMARHSAPIPKAYAGLVNSVTADEASLERGAELFTTHCASCHGDGGMGDGPAGVSLNPAPAPVAHTSQMMGDDYLFWRISEGGAMAPFNSTMPAWEGALDEQARWDVINYIRALGSGAVQPRQGMGGAALDPTAQATRQAEMLATAVAQGVLTPVEADVFAEVHTAVEALRVQGMENMSGDMNSMQVEMLAELVQAGTITQEQADTFGDVHTRLLDAGLME